jgi:hypothetical protein
MSESLENQERQPNWLRQQWAKLYLWWHDVCPTHGIQRELYWDGMDVHLAPCPACNLEGQQKQARRINGALKTTALPETETPQRTTK